MAKNITIGNINFTNIDKLKVKETGSEQYVEFTIPKAEEIKTITSLEATGEDFIIDATQGSVMTRVIIKKEVVHTLGGSY